MPANKPFLPPFIQNFLDMVNWRRTDAEDAIEQSTRALPPERTIPVMGENQHASVMGIPAQEANFLAMMTRMLSHQEHKGPMRAIDIGTFTGRSALAIAQAMPEGGKVLACDINEEFAGIAQQNWNKAGADISGRIELQRDAGGKLQQASHVLDELIANGKSGTFDLVFIDADKPGYRNYYEKALQLLRPGGLVVLDNMLWSGHANQPEFHEETMNGAPNPTYDPSAKQIRDLNLDISKDERVQPVLLGFEDGVMVAEKLDPRHRARLNSERMPTEVRAR